MEKDIIKELNTFLEGNYMAIHAYDHYIHHIGDERLKRILQDIQQQHKQHASMVAEQIQNLGGMPVHDVGMMGSVAEFMSKLKGATTEQAHILKDALIGEQRGIKKSKKILNHDLDEESLNLVEQILDRDQVHVKRLHELIDDSHLH